MKTWIAMLNDLRQINKRDRKAVFKDFKLAYPNWRPRTFTTLELVVVDLEKQVDVCILHEVKKQALNRSVRHYKFFLSKHKTFKQLTRKNHERKNSMDRQRA
jgi:hypothetical protein